MYCGIGHPDWTYQVPAGWQTALPSDLPGTVPALGFVVISP